MLRHVVMFKLSDRNTHNQIETELKKMLEDLNGRIPSLHRIEVGLNISTRPSAFDLVLTADFEDEQGLRTYRIHPAHKSILAFLEGKVQKSAVVDYYV